MNYKCDECNFGFFNFPTCEGNQYFYKTIKLELTFISFSKLVIVMEMARLALHVMTMEYVVVKPISQMTNVMYVMLAFLTFLHVQVSHTKY